MKKEEIYYYVEAVRLYNWAIDNNKKEEVETVDVVLEWLDNSSFVNKKFDKLARAFWDLFVWEYRPHIAQVQCTIMFEDLDETEYDKQYNDYLIKLVERQKEYKEAGVVEEIKYD